MKPSELDLTPKSRSVFVTIEKKSLINNLRTAKKAVIASTPTDAKVSGKVTPRSYARLAARLEMRVRGKA
jgi:hypothetical protein